MLSIAVVRADANGRYTDLIIIPIKVMVEYTNLGSR